MTQEWCDCASTLWPALHIRCDIGAMAPNQSVDVNVSLPVVMTPPPEASMVVNQPAGQFDFVVVDDDPMKSFRPANFGGSLYFGPVVTADLVLANQPGSQFPERGCGQHWVNSPAGKIALISRGDCEFGVKVVNAEIQGAVGAIIYNRYPFDDPTYGAITWMAAGAVGLEASIPAVFISLEAGTELRAALDAGTVNLTMGPSYPEPWTFEVLAFVYNQTNDPNADNDAVLGEVVVGGTVVAPTAAFTYAPAEPLVGDVVQFTDASTGAPTSWAWSFGDGATSAAQNPTHAFAAAGAYTVSLTATNSAGSNTATETVTVSEGIVPPVAAFTFAPAAPAVGQPVTFTNATTGTAPITYAWAFGDGATSTDVSPAHAYAAAGTYTVSLTATNAAGSNTATHDVTVTEATTTLYFIAAAGNAAGAGGSQWATDVEINNPTATAIAYHFLWLPRDTDNSSPTASDSFTLAAGASVRYSNVLDSVFGGTGFGALAVAADSADAIVMSRTYNISTAGTFGQSITGLETARLIQAGQRMRIVFMSEDDAFRANLGMLNGTGSAMTVNYALYGADGTMLSEGTKDLRAWENTQLNRVFQAYAPVSGYVDVWTETAGAAFAAYGSVVDAGTGDPTTVEPEMVDPAELYFLAAAGNAAGAGGSQWATDVEINNPGDAAISYHFLWLPRDTDNSTPTASESFTLEPGASVRYENVLDTVFGGTGFGALAVATDAAGAIVTSRTYNISAAGTFGQSIPGLSGAGLIQAGQRMRVVFMSEDDAFRANLGMLNGTGSAMTVNYRLYGGERRHAERGDQGPPGVGEHPAQPGVPDLRSGLGLRRRLDRDRGRGLRGLRLGGGRRHRRPDYHPARVASTPLGTFAGGADPARAVFVGRAGDRPKERARAEARALWVEGNRQLRTRSGSRARSDAAGTRRSRRRTDATPCCPGRRTAGRWSPGRAPARTGGCCSRRAAPGRTGSRP